MKNTLMNPCLFVAGTLLLLSPACSFLEKATKHGFEDGYYRLKTPDKKDAERIYVVSDDFSGRLNELSPGTVLSKTMLDIDLTSVVFKLRPPRGQVPIQLNSNLNAAAYAGYRADHFKVIREERPLRPPEFRLRQTGFDAGPFIGLGSTPINETVTNGHTGLEYDGLVFQVGLAAFLGVENLGFGVGVGIDNLLDKNRSHWVYQRKPWVGLLVGLAIF